MTKRHQKTRKHKRPVPAGFSSWKAYMASIRPGGTKHHKRRASNMHAKKRGKKARPRARVVIVNKPAKRRHMVRRAGGFVRKSIGRIGSGLVGGFTILTTEVGTRLIRSRVLGMPAGTLLSGLTEVAISTTAGLTAAHFIGEETGQRIIDAGFASVMRATAKQLKAPIVADALSDDVRRQNFVVRGGRVFPVRGEPVNGYVRGRMDGYVPGARRAAGLDRLGGYVRGGEAAAVAQANL